MRPTSLAHCTMPCTSLSTSPASTSSADSSIWQPVACRDIARTFSLSALRLRAVPFVQECHHSITLHPVQQFHCGAPARGR